MGVFRVLVSCEKNLRSSVCIPAISSGIFGFPKELCAKTIFQAINAFCEN